MLFVKNSTAPDLAHAYQNIWAIHTKGVDQNVQLTLTVLPTEHVCETNAKIHVQVHVHPMLHAKLFPTLHLVFVKEVTLAIHSVTVRQSVSICNVTMRYIKISEYKYSSQHRNVNIV